MKSARVRRPSRSEDIDAAAFLTRPVRSEQISEPVIFSESASSLLDTSIAGRRQNSHKEYQDCKNKHADAECPGSGIGGDTSRIEFCVIPAE